ncbi:signal peptide peptidase [Halorubrum californiense DSM 19288]|uniref:Signal peptide peptidase n=1 Tax=Halorubrum californiense DSM 19288 TaxID=1227465 RepID=M0EFG3_9EURY|nr:MULTISPECIES: S49 family peptidase [Halorubrum]ELZ45823.1 signal peptide peptidase [Halorubrum californiense DSM 19288]TKX69055.1 S49 family peptidase [Halorubrum sp. GN11GM_10-3_MGM]
MSSGDSPSRTPNEPTDDAESTSPDRSPPTTDRPRTTADRPTTNDASGSRLDRIETRHAVGVAAILAVAAGLLVAPGVYGAVTGPDGTVAVIEIDGTIDSGTAQHVEDNLRDARTNDSIEAVVLEVDSGGGLPAQSERMYAAVDRTASVMPVYAAVDTLGASGAYLAIAPADRIYVAPSAQAVGSVGVAGTAPAPSGPNAGTTGPDKRGSDPDTQRERRQTLANLFIENVIEQRGDEIELDREAIAHADAYLGTEAVENGFADRFGFVDGAVADAASEAGIDDYTVDTRRTESPVPGGIPLLERDDGTVVVADGSQAEFGDGLILAVAPQAWDETVGDDVVMTSYTGRLPADGDAASAEDTTSGDESAAPGDDSAAAIDAAVAANGGEAA